MPYFTVAPRPILKRHDNPSPTPSPSQHAVHFPPSPALTRVFSAHSPAAYDRSPIVISPNSCTLPERGCPGRTYYSPEDAARAAHFKGVHPRRIPYQSRPCDIPPPLVPDLSSESEESDSFMGPFYEPPAQNHNAYNASGLAVNIARHDACYTSVDGSLDALSFLPYSPSTPTPTRSYMDDDEASPKARRRRPSRERRHESSRDPDRIRNEAVRSESPNHRGRRRQSSSKTRSSDRPLSICGSFSSPRLEEDGCLGGF